MKTFPHGKGRRTKGRRVPSSQVNFHWSSVPLPSGFGVKSLRYMPVIYKIDSNTPPLPFLSCFALEPRNYRCSHYCGRRPSPRPHGRIATSRRAAPKRHLPNRLYAACQPNHRPPPPILMPRSSGLARRVVASSAASTSTAAQERRRPWRSILVVRAGSMKQPVFARHGGRRPLLSSLSCVQDPFLPNPFHAWGRFVRGGPCTSGSGAVRGIDWRTPACTTPRTPALRGADP
ncbi:hypothetical protein SETIT_7G048500v2 [Setaria italica]|uniref:Uncharacterized protein n=1 Tax=Setaria italica TaxID=4555 RepID=A0A368RS69_SETIT|nr:hypothetical protein SETIT_7G048500v2 [Setaria italica]